MEIKMNKEILDYKETIFFGLTMRQFIFSLIACVVAVSLYFLFKPYFGIETLSWICIFSAIPFAVLGFAKYNGMYAEEFIIVWIKSEILMPKVLLFKPTNFYEELLEDEYKKIKKEAMKIERKREHNRKNKKIDFWRKRANENTKIRTTSNTNNENIRRWNISNGDD